MRKNRFAAAILAGMMLVSNTAYAAKSVSELREELAKKQKESQQIKKQIEEKKNDKNAAMENIRNLDTQISGVQDDIDEVQSVINDKQKEINEANIRIEGLNKDIEKTTEKLKARMKVMYEYGSTSYLEIIMEAKGFSDLFTRIEAVQAIVRHDNSVIDKYSEQIEQLQTAKQIVENEQAEQIEVKNILKDKQDELEGLRSQKSAVVAAINSDITQLEAAEKQKEKDMNSMQAEINKALAAANKSSTKVVYKGNGKFAWPSAASTRVTSNFGYRVHPISGVKKLHRGIDIGAAAGTDVLAAEAGVVLTAGSNGSYGNYVTINHGGGYVTLYAHNSKLLVKAGQTVTRGQTIAKCGSTGNSTGPHIHFEVQVNGGLVNPLKYL